LQEKLNDFKFEYIPPAKFTKPHDPFGFLVRQKILQQDVPQQEILPPNDDLAAQMYTAPMLGKILDKYKTKDVGKESKNIMSHKNQESKQQILSHLSSQI